MDPQIALTEVGFFGIAAVVVAAIIAFALVRGTVSAVAGFVVFRRSEKPLRFWATVIGFAYTLAVCIWFIVHAAPSLPVIPMR